MMSLRGRTVLYFGFIVALLAVVGGVTLGQLFYQFHYRVRAELELVQRRNKAMAGDLVDLIAAGKMSEVKRLLVAASSGDEDTLCLFVVDSGEVVAHTFEGPVPQDITEAVDEYGASVGDGAVPDKARSVVYFKTPIGDGGSTFLVRMVNLHTYEEVPGVIRQLASWLGIGLTFGLLLSLYLAERLTWQVGSLTARLRNSETNYRTLFHGSPLPVVVLDGKGAVCDANESACELFHCSHSQIVDSAATDGTADQRDDADGMHRRKSAGKQIGRALDGGDRKSVV